MRKPKDIRFLIQHLPQEDVRLYEALVSLNGDVASLLSAAESSTNVTVSGGAAVVRVRYNLTAPTTINFSVLPDGSLMTLEIKQDATGGWAITWGANFETGLDTQFLTDPNRLVCALFYSDGTLWRIISGWQTK